MSSSSSQSSDADSDGFNEDEIERLLDLKRAELAELEQAKGGEEESDNDQDKEAAAKDADPSSSLARGLEPTPIMESVDNSLAPQGAPLDLEEEEEVDVYDLLERVDNGQHRLPPRKMKRVLVHRGVDHFDPLPNGWVEVTHDCGLPVFLHKQSRVATFAKPYFLGPASVRNHTVPGSAIPCYHARKLRAARAELELAGSSTSIMTDVKEEPQENGGVERSDGGALAENTPLLRTPKIKLQSASEVARTQLNADDIFAYAKDLFEFTEICVYKFRNWTDTRRFGQEKAKKQVELAGSTPRPGLPKNVRLLTIPSAERMAKPHQRALYLTLHDGKSSISILHEYSQKVLKCVVEYGYTETRWECFQWNSAMPYHAVVRAKVNRKSVDAIGDLSVKEKIRHLLSAKPSDIDANPMAATEEDTLVLGEGDGNSKKVAKLMAAKAAVGSLLPGVTFDNDGLLLTANGAGHDDGKDEEDGQAADQCAGEDDAYALFDQCAITDTRVPDLSFKTGQPSPYITLQEILKRSVAFCDLELRPMQSRRLRHQQHLFELGVGEYTAKVVASNKRDGKQKAAQELIRRLLPEMKNWGSILRVYGQESKMKQREIRKSQESVIKLQDEARKQNETGQGSFEPNKAILDKLRGEMMKLSRNLNGSDTTQQDASHLGNAKKRRLGADPIEEEIFVRPLKLSITQTPTFDIDTQ